MKNTAWILFLIACLTLSSCSQMALLYMGMKYPKVLKEDEIAKYSKKIKIPDSSSFYVDMDYIKMLRSKDTTRGNIKDHYQPMQALYFNKENNLERWFINCRAYPTSRGVIWNKHGEFDNFLPKGNNKPDSLITLTDIISAVKSVTGNSRFHTDQQSITVVVFYNRFYHRLSKNLIKEVKKNAGLTSEKLNFIYVNTDNYIVPQLNVN